MNKTISVNISGIIFNIEEEAYQKLSTYLTALRTYLSKSVTRDEIIADVEARIAELFSEKVSDKNQVITGADVDSVISTLGQPEDFELDEEDLEKEPVESKSTQDFDQSIPKEQLRGRVFRNPDDKIAGGVLSGFAAYFDHDPLWWRLIFVVAFICGFGSPLVLYVILWLIIPIAKTRAEKLQMRGEPVTLENIRKSASEEAEAQTRRASGQDSTGEKARDAAQEVVQYFLNALKFVFRIFGKFMGAFCLLSGIGLIIFVIVGSILHFTGPETGHFSVGDSPFDHLFDLVPSSTANANLIQYGAIIWFTAWAIIMLLIGIRLLLKQFAGFIQWRLVVSVIVTGVIGIVMFAVGGSRTAMDYRHEDTQEVRTSYSLTHDTIRLSLNKSNSFYTDLGHHRGRNNGMDVKIGDQEIFSGAIRMNIERVDSLSPVELKVESYARGSSSREAFQRARNIRYSFKADSTGNFVFEPWFKYPKTDLLRDQGVDITLYLPIGKSVYLSPGIEKILYNLYNVTNTYDGQMVGHLWTMTNEGLKSKDFTSEVIDD